MFAVELDYSEKSTRELYTKIFNQKPTVGLKIKKTINFLSKVDKKLFNFKIFFLFFFLQEM